MSPENYDAPIYHEPYQSDLIIPNYGRMDEFHAKNYDGFPIDSVPMALRSALYEVYSRYETPVPMIFASAIGVLSVACQGLADVERPTLKCTSSIVSPCSLFLITIAESGSGKSTCDKIFKKSIEEFEEIMATQYAEAVEMQEHEEMDWKHNVKSAENRYYRTKKSSSADTDKLYEDLQKLRRERPSISLKKTRLIFSDATMEGILSRLNDASKYIGIFSNEGNDILNGRAMVRSSKLNELWDGQTIHVDRKKTKDSFTVTNPRLTMSLMLQPELFKDFINKNGKKEIYSGFLPRCLICHPTAISKIPVPNFNPPPVTGQALAAFAHRISHLVDDLADKSIEETGRTLKFDKACTATWQDIYFLNENDKMPAGVLGKISGFASRIPENIARLAALFHLYENNSEFISYDHLISAINIIRWYTDQHLKLFNLPSREDQFLVDKEDIYRFIHTSCAKFDPIHFRVFIDTSYIQRYGPNRFKSNQHIDSIINSLIYDRRVFTINFPGNKRRYCGVQCQYMPYQFDCVDYQILAITPPYQRYPSIPVQTPLNQIGNYVKT